ncbi:MAG TPA: exopolysaccharide biosynthesis polyprenyl glycosylphosphotransferase [Hymenobacter sp.]|jgi:exopolysaccharide biosynthesis polyprenyl glycosylphosphotransferase|uniref:exopolysaccharide biosynthesis polyprenyl glycosylphosphotransferase n=1 Tax=Hymenobacter sp. TaxID=1898978 RepID=UPI002EDA070B
MEYNLTFPATERPVHLSKGRNNKAGSRLISTKRVFDAVFALLVVIFILSWLLPLLALLIKSESKGPVLFRQLRTGKDNKPFYCYKLRSMHVNKEADHKQASKGDARITKVGAFLRKTSLDELPQFFNVLRGEMSVVGPRPHMVKHTEEYSQMLNDFMQRHTVAPGITGLAQVRGYRGETKEINSMEKRVESDIWYIKNWSLWLDVKIVAMTVFQTIKGHHNAF